MHMGSTLATDTCQVCWSSNWGLQPASLTLTHLPHAARFGVVRPTHASLLSMPTVSQAPPAQGACGHLRVWPFIRVTVHPSGTRFQALQKTRQWRDLCRGVFCSGEDGFCAFLACQAALAQPCLLLLKHMLWYVAKHAWK
jgi:hypothetical protein